MNILVINAGSSSLKYQLINMENEEVLAKGICERIGQDNSNFEFKSAKTKYEKAVSLKDHTEAFHCVKDALIDPQTGVIKDLSEIAAVGHRVVQGGALFSESVIIDDKVVDGIESLIPLAPLHNKAHVDGIKGCMSVLGESVPEVAVFDTAFHATMPQKAYMYAVPYEYYEKYGVRRYGFHGTSHRFVSSRCAEIMGKDLSELKLIICHLGNGSSITAVDHGKVVDTSMGLTPLGGFMMGTRTGSLDPSVVTFIEEKENLTPEQMSNILNKKSGLLGISGVSSDDRDINAAIAQGNKRALLAAEMFEYEILKFIGSYYMVLGGCDAIVFTGGIGENGIRHRAEICKAMGFLGLKLNEEENKVLVKGKEGKISLDGSSISAFVIPTNEELLIARDTKELISKK